LLQIFDLFSKEVGVAATISASDSFGDQPHAETPPILLLARDQNDLQEGYAQLSERLFDHWDREGLPALQ
tara:strand:+ start:1916 stop:2125 length:210 start_codon:yes stop_codon:yes gene_type:complete